MSKVALRLKVDELNLVGLIGPMRLITIKQFIIIILLTLCLNANLVLKSEICRLKGKRD